MSNSRPFVSESISDPVDVCGFQAPPLVIVARPAFLTGGSLWHVAASAHRAHSCTHLPRPIWLCDGPVLYLPSASGVVSWASGDGLAEIAGRSVIRSGRPMT